MNHLFFIRTFLFCVLIPFVTSRSFSQALILEEGQKSTHIGAGFDALDELRGAFVFGSYSPNNKVTIGLDLFRVTIDDVDDLSQIGIAPHISYYFVRANQESPVSVGMGASYARSVVRSETLKSFGVDITENSYRGSLLTAWHASQGRKSKVILTGDVGYAFSKAEVSDPFFEYEESSEGISGVVSCILSFASGSNAFNIVPRITITEDDFGFGLYFGYSLIK